MTARPEPLDLTRDDAVLAIVREHGAFVHRALARLGVREADVDDAFQEVLVVVHRRLSDFEGRSSLRTWLYGIAVRTAAAFRRRAAARYEIPVDEVPDGEVGASAPDAHAAAREALRALDRALETLDDARRAVFVLYEIEELDMPEVAAALGCPLQTAYSRHKVAREQVLTFLRREGEREGEKGRRR